MGHSFDMLTFDFLLKPPQPFTGLFLAIKPMCKVLKNFNIPIFSKIEITIGFNGLKANFYH